MLDQAEEVNKNVTKESKKFDKDLCEDPIEEKLFMKNFKLMVVTSTRIQKKIFYLDTSQDDHALEDSFDSQFKHEIHVNPSPQHEKLKVQL